MYVYVCMCMRVCMCVCMYVCIIHSYFISHLHLLFGCILSTLNKDVMMMMMMSGLSSSTDWMTNHLS